jgi:hypothetical protein
MFRAFLGVVGRAAWFAVKGLIITIFYMKFKAGTGIIEFCTVMGK